MLRASLFLLVFLLVTACGGSKKSDSSSIVFMRELYSRGNDDMDEVDEANVSNYETARIEVALDSKLAGNAMDIGLRYRVELRTDEAQSAEIGALFRLVGNGQQKILGTALSADIVVARVPLTENKHSGVASVEGPTREGTYVPLQIIEWEMQVIGGQARGVSLRFRENDRAGRRPAKDLLTLVESTLPNAVVGVAFPAKRGGSRGVAVVGN